MHYGADNPAEGFVAVHVLDHFFIYEVGAFSGFQILCGYNHCHGDLGEHIVRFAVAVSILKIVEAPHLTNRASFRLERVSSSSSRLS